MITFFPAAVSRFIVDLRDLEWEISRGKRPLKEARGLVKRSMEAALLLDMPSVGACAKRMNKTIGNRRPPTEKRYPTESLRINLVELRSRLEDEFEARTFLYLSAAKTEIWKDPSRGWDAAVAAFPDTATDVAEAGYCLAVERGTACVFHLMRVMEIGVQKLGTAFGVSNVQEKLWGSITNEFHQKVNALPDSTLDEKQYKEALSGTWLHLDYVRRAWRNTTMHPKQTYTDSEAIEVFERVRVFMNDLSGVI